MSALRSLFGTYVRSRIRRGLDGLWVRDLDAVLGAAQSRPVVLAATHVAWWDGMLLFPLDEALGQSGRVWMNADNLARHAYFRALGAMPLDASSAGGLRSSVRAAASWLDRPGRQLWVFPQGRQQPQWVRPLELQPGAAWLARYVGAALVPVAIAYGFRESPVPSAVVSFGQPVHPDHLEAGLLRELAATDRFLTRGDDRFEPIVGGSRRGTQDSLPARALAQAAGRG